MILKRINWAHNDIKDSHTAVKPASVVTLVAHIFEFNEPRDVEYQNAWRFAIQS